MKEVTAEGLLRRLARRYVLARQACQGSPTRQPGPGAEMNVLAGIARNDLGASFKEWRAAVDAAARELEV